MKSEKAHSGEESGEDGSTKARNEKEPSFPKTENQLCRGLVAPESQSEIEEEHRPSCMLGVL